MGLAGLIGEKFERAGASLHREHDLAEMPGTGLIAGAARRHIPETRNEMSLKQTCGTFTGVSTSFATRRPPPGRLVCIWRRVYLLIDP
jgi:hypothetical protein